MEVRDAPGWPGFSGEGAGSFAGKLKARVENCEIKKIPASDQNSPSRPARREVLRSKFITRSISSPLKCLGSITAFPAGQSAAKQPRCAAERRDWDRGAATPEALSPHARTRDRKSTRLNSSHGYISYAVFCLKKKNNVVAHSFVCLNT